MQSKLFVLLFICFSLLLSGCGFDESLEASQQHDGDDIGVIENIWPQALDQMLRWLSAPIVLQQSPDRLPPSYVPTSVSQQSSNQTAQSSTISSQISEQVIQTVSPPIVSEDNRGWEDVSNWEDD